MYNQEYFRVVNRSYNSFDSVRFKTVIGVINKLPSTEACLDAGSGGGHYLAVLPEKFDRTVGLEYSKDGIRDCKTRVKQPVINGSLIGNLPFKNRVFDLILCSEVLEHLSDTSAVLSEISRVLKPDGKVLLTVPNFTKMSFEYIREIVSQKDPTHVHRYPIHKWKTILSEYFNILSAFTSSFACSFPLFKVGVSTNAIIKIEDIHRKMPVIKNLGRECVFLMELKNRPTVNHF